MDPVCYKHTLLFLEQQAKIDLGLAIELKMTSYALRVQNTVLKAKAILLKKSKASNFITVYHEDLLKKLDYLFSSASAIIQIRFVFQKSTYSAEATTPSYSSTTCKKGIPGTLFNIKRAGKRHQKRLLNKMKKVAATKIQALL